jgi:hypothetical protein
MSQKNARIFVRFWYWGAIDSATAIIVVGKTTERKTGLSFRLCGDQHLIWLLPRFSVI